MAVEGLDMVELLVDGWEAARVRVRARRSS